MCCKITSSVRDEPSSVDVPRRNVGAEAMGGASDINAAAAGMRFRILAAQLAVRFDEICIDRKVVSRVWRQRNNAGHQRSPSDLKLVSRL